jgi:hypothetical protein
MEHTNNARFSNPGFNLVAQLSKSVCNNVGSAVFFVPQFGVGVYVSAGFDPVFNFARIHNKLHSLIQASRIAGFAACCNSGPLLCWVQV